MSKKIIEVSGLQKSYKETQVLKDVSFSIDKGSIFALLGTNGAGKTTVIRILATLLKSDAGRVVINGFDAATNGDDVRKCISLTGQFVAVDEALTGKENLKLIARLRHLPNCKDTVNEWLAFSDLADAADRKVSTYSGGMQRRLDIAMSLMGNPAVLFLDEPTTGLDPQNRIAMWNLIKDLAKKGTTVFLTTQYLEEAENLADHIAILHDGEIIAEGTAKQLKEKMPDRGVRLKFDSEIKADIAIKILTENEIVIDSIEQNLPSLEDVFLALTEEKKENRQYEKTNINIVSDAWVMFRRCLTISLRNPETLLTATIIPFFLMFLFGTVFGGISDVGDFNYIDYIVPGILLQSIGQASQFSAMNVTVDMTKGIIDRFRCMSISKSAVLLGHTGAGMIRGIISNVVIILTALILGFRPQAGVIDWLLVVLLLLLINITVSLIAVLCGMIAKSAEGAGGLLMPLFILPFISSGFAPVDSMPGGLRWFAAVQPMTPMIDSLRTLMLDLPPGNSIWLALVWCAGLSIVSFTVSMRIYNRKLL